MQYVQRVVICSIAVISIGMAPFVYKSKTTVGMIIRFAIAVLRSIVFLNVKDLKTIELPHFRYLEEST